MRPPGRAPRTEPARKPRRRRGSRLASWSSPLALAGVYDDLLRLDISLADDLCPACDIGTHEFLGIANPHRDRDEALLHDPRFHVRHGHDLVHLRVDPGDDVL